MNILKLADHIETLPHNDGYDSDGGFTMSWINYKCGSPACIAGWAAHFSGAQWDFDLAAAEWLGLNYEWSKTRLFYPTNAGWLSELTPQMAAAALRRVAASGDKYIELNTHDVWGLT